MPRLHLEDLPQAAEFWTWVWFRPSSLDIEFRFHSTRHRVALSRETHA